MNSQFVDLVFPFPSEFRCPFCYTGKTTVGRKGGYVYLRHEDLGKHLRAHHPGVNKRWVCAACPFTDESAYALKKVRRHHADVHGNAGVAGTPTPPSEGTSSRVADAPCGRGGSRSPRDAAGQEPTERVAPSSRPSVDPSTCGGTTTCTPTIRTSTPKKASPAPRTSSGGQRAATTTSAAPRKEATTSTTKRSSGAATAAAPRRTSAQRSPSGCGIKAFLQRSRQSAGEKAPTVGSGGSESMGRRISGGNTTVSPATKKKSPAPAPRVTTRSRSVRATSEPPKPDPPRRAPARRVTPSTTYAEVTRGPTPAAVESTAPTRRTRATSLPPASQRTTRATAKMSIGGAPNTSTPPPTTTATSRVVQCSASTTLTTTTTTVSVCGRPIPSPTTSPSGIGLPPIPPPPTSVRVQATVHAVPATSGGDRGDAPSTSASPPTRTKGTTTADEEEKRSPAGGPARRRKPPSPRALPVIEESSSEEAGSTEEEKESSSDGWRNASTTRRRRKKKRAAQQLEAGTPSPRGAATPTATPGQPQRQQHQQQAPEGPRGEAAAKEVEGPTDGTRRGPNCNLLTVRAVHPPDQINDNINNNNNNPQSAGVHTIKILYVCSACGGQGEAGNRHPVNRDEGRAATEGDPPTSSPRDPRNGGSSGITRRCPKVTGGVSARRSSPGRRRGTAGHLPAHERQRVARNPPHLSRRQPAGTSQSGSQRRGETSGTARRGALYRSPNVVAATTRAQLVALAEAAATPEQLEGLATKVAGFFQSRTVAELGGNAEATLSGGGGRSGTATGAGAHSHPRNNRRATDAPTSHGEYVREATRLQRLFRAKKKRAVGEILKGPSPHCQVPKDLILGYFNSLYARKDRPEPLPPLHFEEPLPGSNDTLVAPFTQAEVGRRLQRMKNSSPGPDGLSYGDLRKGDPGAVLLTAVFNTCRQMERIPDGWKESNTVLVHKKGDRDDLSNWRPLAMGDVIPKLFAAVLADRLTRWAVTNKRLSSAQKGFLPYEGCLEHNFVLQETLADARGRRKEVVVAWLDLSNAFGSVPHATILGALSNAGVPGVVANVVASLYTDCTTRVRSAEGFTEKIPMQSGVRQGCPLSPILFNLALEPVIRGIADSGEGYEVAGETVTALAYADDIALVTSHPEGMERLLRAAEEGARALGLSFNPRKCATLHIKGSGGVAQTEFRLRGEPVPKLGVGEPYEHLGIPTGAQVEQTPYQTIQGMLDDLGAIDRSLLTPWQKVDAVATFLLPRLDFLLRGAAIRKSALAAADKAIKRTVKAWLYLPQRASPEVVFIPPSWGGCGLLPLADLADATVVAHAFRMLNAGDPMVARVARSTLLTAVRERLRREPSNLDLAEYLSGSLDGDFARPSTGRGSFWSRVRSAATRSGARLGFRWRWDSVRDELSVETKSRNGRTVVVTPSAKGQIIRRMRASVSECYMASLLRKPDQGKVLKATSVHGVSNHFMRTGAYTRFADWRFVHRARLDVLPLNGARRWGTGDRRCRRCGYELETLPHVLAHCGPHSAARQLRHNNLVSRLVRALRLPGEVRVDKRIPGTDGDLAALRPDIVVTHELSRTVVMVDVCVPFENTLDAIEEARVAKILKYQPLAESLRRRGYRVHVDAFVVGALGAWDPGNEALLSLLRVSSRYATVMRRLMISETIAWSRDIYVEHVSGVRQYSVNEAVPEVPPEEAATMRPVESQVETSLDA